ncbi:MAG: TolC family outer membrane protein [Gammaproteobacteria bacterium]|nr:TolC family outer membrane protein [Gammaproteobacteria bacterium]
MDRVRCFLIGLLLSSQGFCADLMDVYHQALDNDPSFKAAYSTFLSQSETLPQAWAQLLPQLTLTALIGRNNQSVDAGVFVVEQTYNGDKWTVNASQTVFNYAAWEKVKQARAGVKSALATFNDNAQQLMMRTTKAYLDLLLARDTLTFSQAKKRANKRQLDQAQERFNVGLDAITAVYEARSAFDQSVAEVIGDQNNLVNQNEKLSLITNHTYKHVAVLRNNRIPLIKPEPAIVDEWISAGLKQNYSLYAAKYALQAAREKIKAASAGNWPVFTIQGNVADTHYNSSTHEGGDADSLVNDLFIPQEQMISSISLNASLPIYQGGLVASQTRQASFDFQTSSHQMEKAYRDVVVNSNIHFNTVIQGIEKVKADRQTVISQQNSTESVEAQYAVGTRTMTDVVITQQRLFEAQQQLASDQYALILSTMNLKYFAGTLNVMDLEEINSWLETTRVSELAINKANPACQLNATQKLIQKMEAMKTL